jgi:hypothetical protein
MTLTLSKYNEAGSCDSLEILHCQELCHDFAVWNLVVGVISILPWLVLCTTTSLVYHMEHLLHCGHFFCDYLCDKECGSKQSPQDSCFFRERLYYMRHAINHVIPSWEGVKLKHVPSLSRAIDHVKLYMRLQHSMTQLSKFHSHHNKSQLN